MATSTWDSVRDDKGEVNGDVLSISTADSQDFSCRNAFIRGHLRGTRMQDWELTT